MPVSTGMRDVREPLSVFAYEMKRPHPTLTIQSQVRPRVLPTSTAHNCAV